ncbi:hypothetical protein C1703_06690 [Streptomyces sp. Go-475]|nr:hypothetical protein C1703_06690 [Streptomyces sp. Go-475]
MGRRCRSSGSGDGRKGHRPARRTPHRPESPVPGPGRPRSTRRSGRSVHRTPRGPRPRTRTWTRPCRGPRTTAAHRPPNPHGHSHPSRNPHGTRHPSRNPHGIQRPNRTPHGTRRPSRPRSKSRVRPAPGWKGRRRCVRPRWSPRVGGAGGVGRKGGEVSRGAGGRRRVALPCSCTPPFPRTRAARSRAGRCCPARGPAPLRPGHTYPYERSVIPARLSGRRRSAVRARHSTACPWANGNQSTSPGHLPGTSPYPAVIQSGRLRS